MFHNCVVWVPCWRIEPIRSGITRPSFSLNFLPPGFLLTLALASVLLHTSLCVLCIYNSYAIIWFATHAQRAQLTRTAPTREPGLKKEDRIGGTRFDRLHIWKPLSRDESTPPKRAFLGSPRGSKNDGLLSVPTKSFHLSHERLMRCINVVTLICAFSPLRLRLAPVHPCKCTPKVCFAIVLLRYTALNSLTLKQFSITHTNFS